jgi:hypothetical protein
MKILAEKPLPYLSSLVNDMVDELGDDRQTLIGRRR